jgi:hypothetical protein
MESLIANMVFLPSFVLGALGGAAGGLFGGVLSHFVVPPKARNILVVVAVIACGKFAVSYANVLKPEYAYVRVMDDLKNKRLFAVIFRAHPEAEQQLAVATRYILANSPSNMVSYDAEVATSKITSEYVTRHLPTSSAPALHKLLVGQRIMIMALQQEPDDCRRYYLGYPVRSKYATAQLEKLSGDILDAKAEIIESSVASPSVAPKESLDSIATDLAEAYQRQGYAAQDLQKVSDVANLPPSDGCRVATEFTSILASFDQTKAARIFKNLMSPAGS